MANIAIESGKPHLAWGRLLPNAFRIGFASPAFERQTTETSSDALPDHITGLIEKIENGYVVDDTGELAQLPRFARTHLKTSVRLGGWE